MRKSVMFIFLLVVCTAASQPPSLVTERAVRLEVENPGGTALVLLHVAPSTAEARAVKTRNEFLEANARFRERTLVIDFRSHLPANAKQLVVESVLSLDVAGSECTCVVAPGTYDIVTGAVELKTDAHRRRRSRRWEDIG